MRRAILLALGLLLASPFAGASTAGSLAVKFPIFSRCRVGLKVIQPAITETGCDRHFSAQPHAEQPHG